MDSATILNSVISKAQKLRRQILIDSNRAVKLESFNNKKLEEINSQLDGLLDLMTYNPEKE